MVQTMSFVSVWSRISCKTHVQPPAKASSQSERGGTEYNLPTQKVSRWNVSHHGSDFSLKANRRQVFWLVYNRPSLLRKTSGEITLLDVYDTQGDDNYSSGVSHQRNKTYEFGSLETGSCQRQLKELDSYFSKLHCDMDGQIKSCENGFDTKGYRAEGQQEKANTSSNPSKRNTTLDSLENYFDELNAVQPSGISTSSLLDNKNSEGDSTQRPNSPIRGYNEDTVVMEPNTFECLESIDGEAGHMSLSNENTKALQTDEEADFYLINLLVAINIAVFLFEIASPINNSEIKNMSLPLVYGAKINKLILVGEWWRLLTPMFLHSGFLHVALSCWVLLTFGPQVCRGYGPFTFLLIYVLGGICGNLTSFIHTPELTVCGTGPVFAIIGAWLVYQIQNKQVVAKDLSKSMFWKAVTATALSFVLSNFGRIDDWTHLGATFSGIIFGYLTCPTLQLLDNTLSSEDGQRQEGIALVRRQADPCKSLLIFAVSILILSCLVFFYGPQLDLLEIEDFI